MTWIAFGGRVFVDSHAPDPTSAFGLVECASSASAIIRAWLSPYGMVPMWTVILCYRTKSQSWDGSALPPGATGGFRRASTYRASDWLLIRPKTAHCYFPLHATMTIKQLLKSRYRLVAPLAMQQLHANQAIRTWSSARVMDNGFGKLSCIAHLPVCATSTHAFYVLALLHTTDCDSRRVTAKDRLLICVMAYFGIHTLGFTAADISWSQPKESWYQ